MLDKILLPETELLVVNVSLSQAQDFFTLHLRYIPEFPLWIFKVEYQNFSTGFRTLTVNKNILFPFQNQIPFGIACLTELEPEPITPDTFISGRTNLYISENPKQDLIWQYAN